MVIKRNGIRLIPALLLVASVSASTPVSTIKAVGTSQSLSQCGGPVQLLWQDGVGQVDVAVIDDSGKVVRSFDRQPANTNSVTWYPVNATAGQKLYLVVKDEAGSTSTSNAMTMASGSSSCHIVADDAIPSFTLFSGVPPIITGSKNTLGRSSTGTMTGTSTDSGGATITSSTSEATPSSSTTTSTTITSTPSSTSSSVSTSSASSTTSATASGQNAAVGLSDAITLSSTLVLLVSLLSSLL